MQHIQAKPLVASLSSRLSTLFSPREAENISMEVLRHFCGLDRMEISLNADVQISVANTQQIDDAIARLLKNEPLQHILGSVEFYGLEFKTDRRALIPRPETEELVDWIIENHPQPGLSILDIGTGTGCIPIVLAKKMNAPIVSAIDMSLEALTLAQENAVANQVAVHFEQGDILTTELSGRYDIIVSNPPYIPEADKAIMAQNVLDYEPELALFVPDNAPLKFYERIALLAAKSLNPGGSLYFEIHEAYGEAVLKMLEASGFCSLILKQDLQGKDRMIKAILL